MLCYLLNKRGTTLKLRCVSGMLWFELHGMICLIGLSVDISKSCVPIFFSFFRWFMRTIFGFLKLETSNSNK